MLQLLQQAPSNYLSGTVTRTELENWLISHLQAILDSNDEEAIRMGNALDVMFLKLNDEFLTDEEFVEQAATLSLRPHTVVRETSSIRTESGSETYRRDPNNTDRLILVA
jgi:hypothetical protein